MIKTTHRPSSGLVPLTCSIGFLEAPLHVVQDALISWRKQHHLEVETSAVEATSLDVLLCLQPLTTPPRRELLLETQSSWTAYFDNGVRGADPFGPISYLAEQIKCRGLIATDMPHTVKIQSGREVGIPGAVQFELFAPERREFLNYERSISVIYDNSKWRFDANGAVQSFEDEDKYVAGRIMDRFTRDMLEEYCAAVGVRLADERFYGPSGVRIQIKDALPSDSREYTLQEARQELGLEQRNS